MTLFDTLFGGRSWRTSEQVIITDVTRMEGDRVCIAGLNGRNSIRLHQPPPREQWLRSIGGLTPGDAVSLSWKSPRRYTRPHLEDADWNAALLTKGRRLSEDELVKLLILDAFSSIGEAFGKPCFYSDNGNAAFPSSKGSRSLAAVRVGSVRVYPHGGGVRADFADTKREWTMIPVEDLVVRNHQRQCRSCSSDLPSLLTSEFDGAQALLRVGLGRPYQAGEHAPACWLQVNHIFLIPSKRRHFV